MKLTELLKFDDIVIQCHDNPDADALASGYALLHYLTKMGKHAHFIYRGRNRITKSNLLIMIQKLQIPVSYEPDFDRTPQLLITVDCQYGQRNVTCTEAENIAVIDHHQAGDDLPKLSEVRSSIGSCSTVLWDMMREEGMSVDDDILLSTALYYGLFTDTGRLSEISHPLDRDMRDSLNINRSLITQMSNSSLSLDELKITGRAVLDHHYCKEHRYLMIRAERCDPNILGVISDFSLETVNVDVCLAYYVSDQEIKFSLRSCVKEVRADELAAFLADGIGGGGGHITKAGGTVRPEKLLKLYDGKEGSPDGIVHDEFRKRLDSYFSMYTIIYAKDTVLDVSDMEMYEKQPLLLGFVSLTDVFPQNTKVEIRTLEGDINLRIADDSILMIGIEGEVYPTSREKLERSYRITGEKYAGTFEYEPCVKDVITGEKKNVLRYAKEAESTGQVRIWAKPLTEHVKLFTAWDEEKYYTGEPGDYIAVREDDPHDIYIINKRLFPQLYRKADSK
ncbi:MAG: DHH family phosphoesterase [Lachnospiraceae bacterium]|nr:DHH family phosphoesterase [Lachnospiraceae bacterium]